MRAHSFDTNVLARLLVRDDDEQCRRAELAFRGAVAAGGDWLATVVLLEVSWVLHVAYQFDRATTATALRRLLSTERLVVGNESAALAALAASEVGPADFADCVILEAARRVSRICWGSFVTPTYLSCASSEAFQMGLQVVNDTPANNSICADESLRAQATVKDRVGPRRLG